MWFHCVDWFCVRAGREALRSVGHEGSVDLPVVSLGQILSTALSSTATVITAAVATAAAVSTACSRWCPSATVIAASLRVCLTAPLRWGLCITSRGSQDPANRHGVPGRVGGQQ